MKIRLSTTWIAVAAIGVAAACILGLAFAPRKKPTESGTRNPYAEVSGIKDYYRSEKGFRRDAVELTPEYRAVIPEVLDLTEKELEGQERGRGFIHIHDEVRQRILKEQHGIEWRTLKQMNPELIID